jgi:hypothetical protein
MSRGEEKGTVRQVNVRDLLWMTAGVCLSLALIRFGVDHPHHRGIVVNGWILLWGAIGGLAGKMWYGTTDGVLRGMLFIGIPLAIIIPIVLVICFQMI